MSRQINFRSFAPITGRVDKTNAVVHGVSLITGNLEAEGHKLHVDDKTLEQVHSYSSKRQKITVKMDHTDAKGKAFKAIAGYLTNFSVDGDKVRGDLELLKEEPMTPKILEMAERMPENFGLSISFKGDSEKKSGKNFARCEKLLSVDLVEQPAANPDGLFSARVDTGKAGMPENEEPTLADVMAAVKGLSQQFTQLATTVQQHGEFIGQVQQTMGEPDLAELAEMSDDQLAELGFTRDQVDEAIADAQAAGEYPGGEDASQAPGGAAAGAPAAAGAGAPAAGGNLSAQVRGLVQFEMAQVRRHIQAQAEDAEAEHALGVIEAKVTELSTKNTELTNELSAKNAEIESLRRTLKLSGNTGVRAGGEVTLFSVKPEEAKAGTFEHHFATKLKELTDKQVPVLTARSQAMDFCVRRHPTEYKEWRAKGSVIELGK